MLTPDPSLLVAALYRFAPIDDPAALQAQLLPRATALGLKGTLLLAHEGLNGTLAGPPSAIAAFLHDLRALPGFEALEHKESPTHAMPFQRLKILLKREIVTLDVPGVDPTREVGVYVPPERWNALLDDPDVVLIDTRNDFEVRYGTFTGAHNPGTRSFKGFPAWLDANAPLLQGKKLAMFCTGGIRCEKATSLALSRGFSEVYHLQGGILKYLEVIPEAESRWEGGCFVFDDRVTLGHGLTIQGGDRSCERAWESPPASAGSDALSGTPSPSPGSSGATPA